MGMQVQHAAPTFGVLGRDSSQGSGMDLALATRSGLSRIDSCSVGGVAGASSTCKIDKGKAVCTGFQA